MDYRPISKQDEESDKPYEPTASEIAEEEATLAENRELSKAKKESLKQLKPSGSAEELSNKALKDEVEKAFQQYDANKDGKLSIEECSEYIKAWCIRKALSTEDAQIIATFEDIDENNDGFISKEELYNWLKDQIMLHSEVFETSAPQS